MKTFLWTFGAVVVGIWLFNKLSQAKAVGGVLTFGPLTIKPSEANVYQGPDIDPQTGAYLIPGAQAGTVGNPVQPIS